MVCRNHGWGAALVAPLEAVAVADLVQDHAVPVGVADLLPKTDAAADAVCHRCTREIGWLGVYPQSDELACTRIGRTLQECRSVPRIFESNPGGLRSFTRAHTEPPKCGSAYFKSTPGVQSFKERTIRIIGRAERIIKNYCWPRGPLGAEGLRVRDSRVTPGVPFSWVGY